MRATAPNTSGAASDLIGNSSSGKAICFTIAVLFRMLAPDRPITCERVSQGTNPASRYTTASVPAPGGATILVGNTSVNKNRYIIIEMRGLMTAQLTDNP